MDIENTNNIAKEFFLKGTDGKKIFVYCWDNVLNPKAVIQIFHGMAEHAGRYEHFAKHLNSKGFIVYINDHRGHGKTAGAVEQLGYIGEDGFNKIVEDGHLINEFIQKNHKDLPILIFGFSFGSFVAQEYMISYGSKLKGVILCGSAARTGPEIALGKILANLQLMIFDDKKKSRLLNYLTFFGYNKRIKNNTYKFEWLSCNLDVIKKYEDDPLCGTVFTTGFYYYFFKALRELYKKDRLDKIPKTLPVLIISGSEDPVGNYGSWVKKLYKIYKNLGVSNLKLKLYHGARHELINESNQQEVFSDLVTWIDKQIS